VGERIRADAAGRQRLQRSASRSQERRQIASGSSYESDGSSRSRSPIHYRITNRVKQSRAPSRSSSQGREPLRPKQSATVGRTPASLMRDHGQAQLRGSERREYSVDASDCSTDDSSSDFRDGRSHRTGANSSDSSYEAPRSRGRAKRRYAQSALEPARSSQHSSSRLKSALKRSDSSMHTASTPYEISAVTASSSQRRPLGSSLFLSGPSSELSQQTRTPLFQNVSHVLHARREMVGGSAPGGAGSVFAPSPADLSGPEQLAARARTLGFVAGNMFGASAASSNDTSAPYQTQAEMGSSRSGVNRGYGMRRGSEGAGGVENGMTFIGSLGASIPQRELRHTPGWDPHASASERASQQLRSGLGIGSTTPAPLPAAAAAAAASTSSTPGPRPPPHVPYPRGLLLPSTSGHPHVSLHTLAEREFDVMARWPATMAAAAEMKLRALKPIPTVIAAPLVAPVSRMRSLPV
jgi:hypothetical protein